MVASLGKCSIERVLTIFKNMYVPKRFLTFSQVKYFNISSLPQFFDFSDAGFLWSTLECLKTSFLSIHHSLFCRAFLQLLQIPQLFLLSLLPNLSTSAHLRPRFGRICINNLLCLGVFTADIVWFS